MAAFEEMGVLPEIGKAVEEMDWLLPTDVQAEAIPLILGGGDVLMAAETGSGKTGAFCLPIIQIVAETLKEIQSGKSQGKAKAPAISPTWILSVWDRDAAMAITPDGLRCQSREQKEWHGCRANKGVYSEKKPPQPENINHNSTYPTWFTKELKLLIMEKKKAHANYKRSGLQVDYKKFSSLRAQCCFLRDQVYKSYIGLYGRGKYYYEATVTDEGLCRVGWSTSQASRDLGTDRWGFGFGGTGKKSNNKQFDNYGEAFGMHDVIGCFLDLDNHTVSFSKNGQNLGQAFTINQQLRNSAFYPAVVLKNAEMSFNFGATPFKHAPPKDYVAVCNAPKQNVKHSESVESAGPVKLVNNAPQAIIIEPSRELAEQTFNQIIKFKKHISDPKIRELLIIGGVNVKDQMSVLSSGVDIVVGTPGRMEDLISGGHLALTHCRFFVLDEADGLLKQGYTQLIDRMHKQIPKVTSDGKRLQMIVCSATLHDFDVKKMAERLMYFPTWVDLKGEDAVPDTVHHVVVRVDPQGDASWGGLRSHVATDGVHARDNVRPGSNTPETYSEAVKLLKGEYCVRAIDKQNMDRAIIFCRTKLDCDNLERYFNSIDRRKYSSVCLHGDRKPHERKANLEKFKTKQVKFLICTDVAARGIDITGLPFMINMTLPDDKANYVHRIGRVGRAERMGLAISLVSTVPEKVWYHGEWCSTRGRNCANTQLTDVKGCCIWFDEKRMLGEIEEHLNVTIQQVDEKLDIPADEFDGKVTYGQKRANTGSSYVNHVTQMEPSVSKLSKLESQAQLIYLRQHQQA